MIVIGTDEAGYGPNLGPLVVTATTWSVPSESVFPTFAAELASKGIRIDDSKKVFHQGNLAALEQTISPVLRLLKISPSRFFTRASKEKLVSPDGFPEPPPVLGNENVLALTDTLTRHGMKILDVRTRAVFPGEFNRLLDRYDSKGSLLSETTLDLVRQSIRATSPNESVLVLCDKHGGRNRYLDLLMEFFPGEFFRIMTEGREKSVYRTMDSRLEFRFLAKGDSQTPVALASMFSKYLRELAMIRFNEFWLSAVPGLKPTAGYPEDAKRFKKDIAAAQRKLKIADENLWRKR